MGRHSTEDLSAAVECRAGSAVAVSVDLGQIECPSPSRNSVEAFHVEQNSVTTYDLLDQIPSEEHFFQRGKRFCVSEDCWADAVAVDACDWKEGKGCR